MQIRDVTAEDIPAWKALSREYDGYVGALVGTLQTWYEGEGDSVAFSAYMAGKIAKREAAIAVDVSGRCLGIVAFSRHNNRITFFGVSHAAAFFNVGEALVTHACKQLDASRNIAIHSIASQAPWIERHRRLLTGLGFTHCENALENGVPVHVFLKSLETA